MADLDPRPGIATAWIAATDAATRKPLTAEQLKGFAARVRPQSTGVDLAVVVRAGVPAISVRGDRLVRNGALTRLGEAFYAANHKWLVTTTDFDWLKSHS